VKLLSPTAAVALVALSFVCMGAGLEQSTSSIPCSVVQARIDATGIPSSIRVDPDAIDSHGEALSRTQEVLEHRVIALAEKPELLLGTVSVERRYSIFLMEFGGMSCREALAVTEKYLLRRTRVEMGLVGTDPTFQTWDFQSRVYFGAERVTFRLLEQAADRLRELARAHVGEVLYLRVNDRETHIPIISDVDSGFVSVRREEAPADLEEFLLPFQLEVLSCTDCEVDQAE
jgi:hypothetical protein